MANGADVVAGRELLDDLDIRGEAGAREHALEEIVAEERRVRRAVGERGLEGVDVVDAFSGVGSFPEQILIDVGDGRGVGVDSARRSRRSAGTASLRGPNGSDGVTRGCRTA